MIQKIIEPETELENKIIKDDDLIQGLNWGKSRNGHPEGKVVYHVGHILKNINAFSDNRTKLRLIAIIHDSFKYKVDTTRPKSGDNHHGMYARRFAEKYITDTEILDIIELHDEAYNSWSKGNRNGEWNKAETRAMKLIDRLGDSINLYLEFYQCDNETGNKKGDDFIWFANLI